MSLAAEAEQCRNFGPEIRTHSDITAVQGGIERKCDMHEAQMLHPAKKMICQLFHILGALVASGICRFPVYFAAREETTEIQYEVLKEVLGLTEASTFSSTGAERNWTN